MRRSYPSRVLAGAAFLALVFSGLNPLPVLADDGIPPPTEAPVELADPATPIPTPEALPSDSEPPTEDPAPELLPLDSDGPPEDESSDVDAIPPEDPPDPGSQPDDSPVEDPDIGDLMSLAPEGTELAVIDGEGEILSLASEEAAEIVAKGDPVWCPASVSAPTPGVNGCSPPFSSFLSVIMYLASNPATTDGVIWIEGSYDSGSDDPGLNFVLDGGGTYAPMAMYKLTLRGGWSGTAGDKSIDTSDPSEFNGWLRITNWGNDITLTDLVFTGTSGGDAIQIITTGNVTLTRVNSHNNGGQGASVANNSGSGQVKIVASQFSDNGGSGITVSSNGLITLQDVIASGNGANGATLENFGSASTVGVTLKGMNEFNNNFYDGLYVTTKGNVVGKDLTAKDNGASSVSGSGMVVHNDVPGGVGGITLTGTNIFTGNYTHGINVTSNGPIKLNNLVANSNSHGMGAWLYNAGAPTPQGITLSGVNTLSYNFSYGLYAISQGAITVNSLSTHGSISSTGAVLDNASGTGAGITLSGANAFYDNVNTGLSVSSKGTIKASNLSALGNGAAHVYGWGVTLDNSAATSAKSITVGGSNVFNGNYSGGLSASSVGPISLRNITANNSLNSVGASINNAGALSAQKVTLSGTSAFVGNYYTGLALYASGPVSVSNLTASGNGQMGGSGNGVRIENISLGSAQSVKVSGTNRFDGNYAFGLSISSRGAISASNLTALGNGLGGSYGSGALLDNGLGTGSSVKLSGTNTFSGNYSTGLQVYSAGTVSLASTTASDSINGDGVNIANTFGPPDIPRNVSLSGSHTFLGNYGSGLWISSHGSIAVSSMVASDNGHGTAGYGAYLYNAGAATPRNVSLSGNFTFNDNHSSGLYVGAQGAIKAKNLAASNNGMFGAQLANAAAALSLGGKNAFIGNLNTGLILSSQGPITVSNLTASHNGLGGSGTGASISNTSATTAQKLTISGTNTFVGNYAYGLDASSNGPISLSNPTASGTVAGAGVSLYNATGLAPSSVTLSGTAIFGENWGAGLAVSSYGVITLKTSRLEANGNGISGSDNGVHLSNSGAVDPKNVTVKGRSTFIGNGGRGLSISSKGAISLSHLTASHNLGEGAYVSNNASGSTAKVSISGSNIFLGNEEDGLVVYSRGAISLSNVTASDNGAGGIYGSGAYLDNSAAATPQAIKLTGYATFHDNYDYGLYAYGDGAISARNLTAMGTIDGEGAHLYNAGSGAEGPITLTGSNIFTGNDGTGLYAASCGAISISHLTANDNGLGGAGYGAMLTNSGAPTPQPVKLTGTNTFNQNRDSGLFVQSAGLITVNNLAAYANVVGNGAMLVNNLGGSVAGITLTGTSSSIANGNHGLYMVSNGPVSLMRITADDNDERGLWVQNASSITITCGSFTNNDTYGAYLSSAGLIKLIGIFAFGNPSGGILTLGGGTVELIRNCPLS